MRTSSIAAFLLPSLATAALHPVFNNHVDARHIHVARPTPASVPKENAPAPTDFADELKFRAVNFDPNAPAQPTEVQTQYPSITTQWIETVNDAGVVTYIEFIYTQKFAEVPSQGAMPGQGNIGLGTITGEVGVLRTSTPRNGAVRGSGVEGLGWKMTIAVAGAMGAGAGLILL